MPSTAFITIWGIYELTRFPIGVFHSINYFRKMTHYAFHLLHRLRRKHRWQRSVVEVYIDPWTDWGSIRQERRNRFRKTTGIQCTFPLKFHLGQTTITFLVHEIDTGGTNMAQKRVVSIIDVIRTNQTKRDMIIYRFGQYFHDHIPHNQLWRNLRHR